MYSPCASTSVVPYFDAYILRSAESADSPEEGLSTFAVEMSDARAIIRDTTRESLVFVDELCKGTEAKAGACIAASVAEYLSNVGALGLFATHLDVVSLPGNVLEEGMDFLKMEVEQMNNNPNGNNGGQPTWKIVKGVSKESFAYKVAEQCGVPVEIVQRAIALDKRLKKKEEEGKEEASATESAEREKETIPEREIIASSSPSPSTAPPSLDAALSVVCSIVSAENDDGQQPALTKLKPGQIPPPSTMGHSCVYVLLCKGDSFYVGETDDIVRRWREHRQNYKRDLREFAFVLLPNSSNKSLAREVETKSIRRLEQLGYQLENVNY
jgi:predicted GIY-YIG superfamily endonuclease